MFSFLANIKADAEDASIKACLDSGMDFFLSKPIRRPALKHVLKTYCPPIPEEEGEAATTPPPDDAKRSKPNGQATVVGPENDSSATTADGTVVTPKKGESPAISPLTSP